MSKIDHRRIKARHGPRVNHINAMLERDPDDVVLRKIRGDGRQALSDAISFVRLTGGKYVIDCGRRVSDAGPLTF
jgi:hypothetical protein